jgi:hypothetical protein
VFIYTFNSAARLVSAYFSRLGSHIGVHQMSVSNVLTELRLDRAAARKVALVTPASLSYEFGHLQMQLFGGFPAVFVRFLRKYVRV